MQTIPFNADFESAVIAGILADPTLFPKVSSIINKDDFFSIKNKAIYSAIESLEIDQIDSLAVQDKLPTQESKDYLADLVKNSDQLLPSLTNILFYAEQIKGDSKLRQGVSLGQEIIAVCTEPNTTPAVALQRLEDMFSNFVQNRTKFDSEDVNTPDAFEDFVNNLGVQVSDDSGVRTGYFSIDMLLHRLEGLIVLAARPSVGKTALAINIARNVAEKKPVLFFSLEQHRSQIFERMLSSEAEVDYEEIRTGAFISSDLAMDKVSDAKEKLRKIFQNMHIDDEGGVRAEYITSIARKKKLEWGEIGLIVVDYLHLMTLENGQSKVDGLGTAVKALRNLGKELNCPIIVLSQLSRNGETQEGQQKKARRPELSDLRSSGEIEQSADVVMFLYKESYYDETGYQPDEDVVEVIVRKHRNGRTGTINLRWAGKYVKFTDRFTDF